MLNAAAGANSPSRRGTRRFFGLESRTKSSIDGRKGLSTFHTRCGEVFLGNSLMRVPTLEVDGGEDALSRGLRSRWISEVPVP